ncbi:hypothetical protein K469DRAFT_520923, partial [Zopfia rhizophila CBS 207.26]
KLRHALAVEVGSSELHEEYLPEVEDMVSVHTGLVIVDGRSNIIRLVHYTTQGYFKQTWTSWVSKAQNEITCICGIYIFFQRF